MRKFGKYASIIIGVIFFLTSPLSLIAANLQEWEPVKDVENSAKIISKHQDIGIFTSSSTIIVEVAQPVRIEIFTILGKLVSSSNLMPGIYQYKLNSHGVYIVKCSGMTCKVAV